MPNLSADGMLPLNVELLGRVLLYILLMFIVQRRPGPERSRPILSILDLTFA